MATARTPAAEPATPTPIPPPPVGRDGVASPVRQQPERVEPQLTLVDDYLREASLSRQLSALNGQNTERRAELGSLHRAYEASCARAEEAEGAVSTIEFAFAQRLEQLEQELADAKEAERNAEQTAVTESAAKEALAQLFDSREQEQLKEEKQAGDIRRTLERKAEDSRERKRQLAFELRRLGALLSEVAGRAKRYEKISADQHEHEERMAACHRKEAAEAAQRVLALEKERDRALEMLEELREQLFTEQDEREGRLVRARAQAELELEAAKEQEERDWLRQREYLQDRIHKLQNEADMRVRQRAESLEGKLEQRVREALKNVEDLQALLRETRQNQATEKDEKRDELQMLSEALALIKSQSGGATHRDPRNMALFRRLQEEQQETQALQRENEVLTKTIGDFSEKMQELTTLNIQLQHKNDALRVYTEGAASEAPSARDDFHFRPGSTRVGATAMTSTSEGSEGAFPVSSARPGIYSIASRGTTSEGRGRAASQYGGESSPERLGKDLDTFVDELDNIRNKLESLEACARKSTDPAYREVLLQEMNTLHRQALDDTLAVKRRRGRRGKRSMGLLRVVGEGLLQPDSTTFHSSVCGDRSADGRADSRRSPHASVGGTWVGDAWKRFSVLPVQPPRPVDEEGGLSSFHPTDVPTAIRKSFNTASEVEGNSVTLRDR